MVNKFLASNSLWLVVWYTGKQEKRKDDYVLCFRRGAGPCRYLGTR